MKKAHSRTSLSNVHSRDSKTPKPRRQNANDLRSSKRALPSFSRDRWRNCRLTSSHSIGSECCLEFVIYSQPMVRITIIHDSVATFIDIYDSFMTNGYALPTRHVPSHKMDLQWKPQSNSMSKISLVLYEVVIKISTALHCVCKFAYTNSRRKNCFQNR